jgi:hypothetical protein
MKYTPTPLDRTNRTTLLDLLQQHLGGILEDEVRLIEEEHQFRFLEVAHLWEGLEELRKEPQHEGGIDPRVVHQRRGVQVVDDAVAGKVGLEQVLQWRAGSPKKDSPPASPRMMSFRWMVPNVVVDRLP